MSLVRPHERALVVREPIVIDAARVEELRDRYEARSGLVASASDMEALIRTELEDEVLYREALALGLDRGDRGVSWRLIEKMTFLAPGAAEAADDPAALLDEARRLELDRDDPVVRRILVGQMRLRLAHAGSATEPSDAELQAWLDAHPEHFVQPERTRVSHVLLSRQAAEAPEPRAARLLARLRAEGTPPAAAVAQGDPFALPQLEWVATPTEIAARLGADFAAAVAAAEPGRWSGPVSTVFGVHLIWVHGREPARTPSLDEVRSRVLYGLLAERREAALAARLAALVAAYEVRVERPAWLTAAGSAAGEPRS